ncbi:MAG: septal ring lytic transglycosylase RlpA family protein [Bacteroidales bacterium]|nr:septal ring lytic transglycosylase RlpA family protein [Bacteroidales bacterium]
MKFQKIIFILATILSLSTTTALAQSKGKASYYGNKFHGRRTSDGSRYHKDSLTCAHRTLPFGTLLKVRNQKNGREVVVKVTDRGPFGPGRIVDLSMAAAREIGMVQQGVVPVEVTRVGHVNDSNLLMAQSDAAHETALPQAKYLDPATGKFYTMDEWTERGEKARKEHMARMAQKVQPRYRVLTDKMTAKNISLPKQGH